MVRSKSSQYTKIVIKWKFPMFINSFIWRFFPHSTFYIKRIWIEVQFKYTDGISHQFLFGHGKFFHTIFSETYSIRRYTLWTNTPPNINPPCKITCYGLKSIFYISVYIYQYIMNRDLSIDYNQLINIISNNLKTPRIPQQILNYNFTKRP